MSHDGGAVNRSRLATAMYEHLGNEWCGNAHAPMDHRVLYLDEDGVTRVFSVQNDGFDIGIGHPDHWHVIMSRASVRLFIRWYLWQWVCNWFGLREWLWFAALSRHVGHGWKFRHPRRTVRRSSHDEWWRKEGKRKRAMRAAATMEETP